MGGSERRKRMEGRGRMETSSVQREGEPCDVSKLSQTWTDMIAYVPAKGICSRRE